MDGAVVGRFGERRWCRPGASVVTRRPAAPLGLAVLVWLFSAERPVPGGVSFSGRFGEQLCRYSEVLSCGCSIVRCFVTILLHSRDFP
jgi:hypothetical protein